MPFLANIAFEQEVIVAAIVIALFIFTRFWSRTPAHVQSKSSNDFALRHPLPKSVYKTYARIRRGSWAILESLFDVCNW